MNLKRFIDIIFSIIIFIILLPILTIILLIIILSDGRPIFFTQKRSGLNNISFTLYKFRTMIDKRDEDNNLLSDKFRLTKVGSILRKTSLDELPSLWNVLIGQMSLVGPRPLLVEYLEYYSEEEARRNRVKPGITGWAQINGRNKISWGEKFELDNWYIDNQSFLLDIKILFLTCWKVLKLEGISHSSNETMPLFKEPNEDNSQ